MDAATGTAARPRPPVRITANLFGVGFGLAGLAAAWQAAAPVTSAPGWVADALAVAAAAAWLAAGSAWITQLLIGQRGLSSELHDQVLGPFVSLLPIVGMLLALDLYSHGPGAGRVLFGLFAAATLLLGCWLTGQWVTDRVEFDAVHPGYFLPMVAGGLIAAQGAALLGWPGLSRGLFGIGVLFWLLLGPLILARPIIGPPLPPALSPTLAIEVAPSALAGNAYLALTGGSFDTVTWALTGFTIVMAVMQLRLIPLYRRAPFGPGTWSFTFSYAVAATFALHWISHEHPPGAAAWTWAVLALITAIIAIIAARTVLALTLGQFLPRSPRQSPREMRQASAAAPATSATSADRSPEGESER
jgi:tellurite resistance protein